MTALTISFEFDELSIAIGGRTETGMLLYGTAELVASWPEDPTEGFYVASITLTDGAKLVPSGAGAWGLPCAFQKELFARMSKVIEDDKTTIGRHAASEWADAVERYAEPPEPDHREAA